MGNAEIMLDTKLVGDIEGHFSVPSYQRGYRWREAEVVRLLDDIYTTGSTIDEISREFRRAGVKRIYFLSLAIGQTS